jgi:hypothetical protein
MKILLVVNKKSDYFNDFKPKLHIGRHYFSNNFDLCLLEEKNDVRFFQSDKDHPDFARKWELRDIKGSGLLLLNEGTASIPKIISTIHTAIPIDAKIFILYHLTTMPEWMKLGESFEDRVVCASSFNNNASDPRVQKIKKFFRGELDINGLIESLFSNIGRHTNLANRELFIQIIEQGKFDKNTKEVERFDLSECSFKEKDEAELIGQIKVLKKQTSRPELWNGLIATLQSIEQ